MNVLLVLVALASDNHVNASFYTYRHIGHQSVTDLYLNYVLHRYDLRVALERRSTGSGLKSLALEIDSIPADFRLVLGERPFRVRAPASTYLNIWGLALLSGGLDVFAGKVRDNTAAVPPTFNDNRYVAGVRLRRHPVSRMPLDLYVLHRSDHAHPVRPRSNTAAGINTELELFEGLVVENRLWASHTEHGTGASGALSGRFIREKYGGHCNFETMSQGYVPFSGLSAHGRDWFRLNTYEKPTTWLGFSQDLAHASYQGTRFTFNTRLSPDRLPAITHSLTLSRAAIGQAVDGQWHYKGLDLSANYSWSRIGRSCAIRTAQRIVNCQVWASFQHSDIGVWQFGIAFPFPRWCRFKGYISHSGSASGASNAVGLDVSSKILNDLCVDLSYEYMRHRAVGDQFISLGVSKSLDLDRAGFSFVSGRVFMDLNDNGRYDATDVPLSGIDVGIDGTTATKTNSRGIYMFSFVKAGRHSVSVNLGSMPAEIGAAKQAQVVDTRLLSQVRVDFPLGLLGSVSGTVYFDRNNDGQMDDDEQRAPNVVLALNGFSTTTDGQGAFRFANLASGTYVLEPRILPPETSPALQEVLYLHLPPGADLNDCLIPLVKKERPTNIKVFD